MSLLDPVTAFALSFALLALMLYRRVSIGIALVSAAVFMGVLSMDLMSVANVVYMTTRDSTTVSLVLVTFGIMLLTLLYRETEALKSLSRSFRSLLKNPKLVVSVLPAIVGLLPVPGGALMSAPLVEVEAEKLGLQKERKAFVNIWFRHIIFPIYPMSQVLILAAALTGVPIISLVISQVPIVVAMIFLGYFLVLRNADAASGVTQSISFGSSLKDLAVFFSPILVMILAVVVLGTDVSVAALIGIVLLLLITRPSRKLLPRVILNPSVYKIALAAYGAMLLRSVTEASGISEILGQAVTGSNMSEILLLLTIPAALAFFLGSPTGGIALSVPIISSIVTFNVPSAGLLFTSAYLGYVAAPTHLCLVLTADYFKCSLSRVYKILAPSIAVIFGVAFLVYYALQ